MKVYLFVAALGITTFSCTAIVPYLELAEAVEGAVVAEINGPTSVPLPQTPGINVPSRPSAS